ncbi:hypothetical protein ATJ93_4547 [Halopiger aswanensis]|uniref:Uncharacterized protein n=2 Tax=Halopiger aswanensis TaxID=148449 RepID=A0A419VWU2_9EURY|nr:hypothetical protein ATJ93_4547 [Halopiger aswanensis]
MWVNGIGPDHDGLKANEIEDELELDLEYTAKTSLKHLVDVNIVEEFTPSGPSTLVIASWMDGGDGDVVNGNVTEAAEEGLRALADEVSTEPSSDGEAAATDGGGLSTIIADEFDLVIDKVENFLRTTDRPVDVLNQAVEAIEEADGVEVGEDYGEIAFINMPHRFRLTDRAVSLYEQ